MKITCSSDFLRSAVLSLQNIAQAKISIPAGENILLRADNGKIEFLATNRAVDVRYWGEATVDEPGEMAILARVAQGVVRELYDKETRLESTPSGAVLRCGSGVYRLQTANPEDFPAFTPVTEGALFSVEAADLSKALARTVLATSTEVSRFQLDGVRMDLLPDNVIFVSTDGRRLSKTNIPGRYDTEGSCLIPTSTVDELLKLLPDDGTIQCLIGKSKVSFTGNRFSLVSTLLENNFPPYDQIIPEEIPRYIEVDTEALGRGVRSATVMATEKGRMICMAFREGILEFSGENEEVGSANFKTEIQYDGNPFVAGYRSSLLLDFLRVVDSQTTLMGLITPDRPAILKPKGDDTFLHLVMPMMIEESVQEEEIEEADNEEHTEDPDLE